MEGETPSGLSRTGVIDLSAPAAPIEFIQKKHVYITPKSVPQATLRERSEWAAKRRINAGIIRAFDAAGDDWDKQNITPLQHCMRAADWRECPDHHEGVIHKAEFCGHRMCAVCQKRRSWIERRKYRPVLTRALAGEYTQGQEAIAIFVTLTWPSVVDIDGEHVSRMWRDLRNLDRQKWWKQRVRGALNRFEWTFSPVYGHHSHVHSIVLVSRRLYEQALQEFDLWRGRLSDRLRTSTQFKLRWSRPGAIKKLYSLWWAHNGPLPKSELSRAWKELTGAGVVDIRMIRGRNRTWGDQTRLEAALDELLKYPIKETDYLAARPLRPDEAQKLAENPDLGLLDRNYAVVRLYNAIRGRRLADPRGCIRGHLKEAIEQAEAATAEELLHIGIDEQIARRHTCSSCGKLYVDRRYEWERGRYVLAHEQLVTEEFIDFDVGAKRRLVQTRDREEVSQLNQLFAPVVKDYQRKGGWVLGEYERRLRNGEIRTGPGPAVYTWRESGHNPAGGS